MKRIYMIPCSGPKRETPSYARDLYQSDLFKKNLEYSNLMKPDAIYILSAKYGVLSLNRWVTPYNQDLTRYSGQDLDAWYKLVQSQLNFLDPEYEFTFLTGKTYYAGLIVKNMSTPLEGMNICRRKGWLTRQINTLRRSKC